MEGVGGGKGKTDIFPLELKKNIRKLLNTRKKNKETIPDVKSVNKKKRKERKMKRRKRYEKVEGRIDKYHRGGKGGGGEYREGDKREISETGRI